MMRKINLMHIIGQLPIGGAEKLLLTLIKNINRAQFNVVVCCLDKGGHVAERIRGEGFNVICLGVEKFRFTYKIFIWLMKLLKSRNIDIVHTHLYQADFWGRLISLMVRVPIICRTEHGNVNSFKNKPLPYRAAKHLGINQMLDRLSDAVIYTSEAQKKDFNDNGRSTDRAFVIWNGTDESRFCVSKTREYIRASNGFSSNDILIGVISRLTAHKGHRYLFEAMKKVNRIYSNAKLLVIGYGEEEHNLRKLGSKLNIESNILFLMQRKDVPELMKAMDIYVQPSLLKPFGITIVEAMYSGLPVVATNVGGIPEVVIDGETGILIPTRDSDAIKNALLKLIENPAMARSMGESGRDVALSKFSGQRYARDMEKLYVSLMENEKGKVGTISLELM